MTISVVFSDGTKVTEVETIDDDGYFDGACAINMSSPPEFSLTLCIKQVIVDRGAKQVVYTITDQKSREYRKNTENSLMQNNLY